MKIIKNTRTRYFSLVFHKTFWNPHQEQVILLGATVLHFIFVSALCCTLAAEIRHKTANVKRHACNSGVRNFPQHFDNQAYTQHQNRFKHKLYIIITSSYTLCPVPIFRMTGSLYKTVSSTTLLIKQGLCGIDTTHC